MTVKVLPNGGKWRVKQDGVTRSNHRKKQRAKSSAKRVASSGEQIVIYRANGTIQNRRRKR